MAEHSESTITLRRGLAGWRDRLGASGLGARLHGVHRSWWFKVLAWAALFAGVGAVLLWVFVVRSLPSVDQLRSYEPPLPSNVRSIEGTPIHSYERERRVELDYAEYPQLLIRSFLAAEDRTFFDHGGVDYPGIVSAFITNFQSDGRPIGASTITQQVAKNLLLSNEVSYIRKLREVLLAWRIEDALSKQQILELYLNQIFLGRNAYGVEAASDAYFGKSVGGLTLDQMAYLAILPKGPANYDPVRNTERAVERRNWVLREMRSNEFIDQAQYAAAVAAPLETVQRSARRSDPVGGYFVEEVRRQLIAKFGESETDGPELRNPHSVYSGGLWVRTSLDPELQRYAAEALREGLIRYDRGRGWSGPLGTTEIDGDNWRGVLASTNIALSYEDWRAAIVIATGGGTAEIGFVDGTIGTLPRSNAVMPVRGEGGTAFAALKVGDVIAVAPSGGDWSLRSVPRVSGGMVVEDPRTGRILAMQGGFDSRVQAFNRATQAMRQPGSTIKPIVYAAALESGMTPATIIVDAPFCVDQGARLGRKCFRNFGNMRGAGPRTMRWGIEQSRNLMTIQAANRTGMDKVVDLIQKTGVSETKYAPYLAYALGAGETTVLQMVNAFSILANNGRALNPTLVDFVQDRRGKVILPENWRPCERCSMPDWDGKAMPRPQVRSRQVMNPISAYQMTHILEGVIERGTATTLRDLKRPIMGKTGTTTGPKDVWFIGGTPQMIAGLYIGFDTPTNMGGYAQGGTLAAPIYKQFATKAYEGMEVLPFRAPPGTRILRIDRMSGRPVSGGWPGNEPKAAVIWEAFKPESEPRRARRRTEEAAKTVEKKAVTPNAQPRDSDFLQRQGGIY